MTPTSVCCTIASRNPVVNLVVGSVVKEPRGVDEIREFAVEMKEENVCVETKSSVVLIPSNMEKDVP